MEDCSCVSGGVSSVALGLLDRIQSRAYDLINSPSLTNQLPSLQLRKNVASLSPYYRYFYGYWSDELHAIAPPPLHRDRPKRGRESAHSHSLADPSCRISSCNKSFLPRLVELWNSLPQICIPENFNLQRFKENTLALKAKNVCPNTSVDFFSFSYRKRLVE